MNFDFLINIQEILNKFLYVKPKRKETLSEADVFNLRIEVSSLLDRVLDGEITVLQALSVFPKYLGDDTINVCFHILAHYEADEDLRKNDPLYKEEQDEYIRYVANLLRRGENIPVNIISEYNEYYKESLIYPKITRENVLKRLKKRINI